MSTRALRAAILKQRYLDKFRREMKGKINDITTAMQTQMARDWRELIYPAVLKKGIEEETATFQKVHGHNPRAAERDAITEKVNRLILAGIEKTRDELLGSSPKTLVKADLGQPKTSRKTEALHRVWRKYGGGDLPTITPPRPAYRHRLPSTRDVLARMNRGDGRTLDDVLREHKEKWSEWAKDTRSQPAKTKRDD